MGLLKLLTVSVIIFACLATFSAASVVGVDLGLQHIKGAYLKPGLTRPELLLNELSKRKTPVFVGFREDERIFGDSASLMATRYPKTMFTMLQRTLGKRFDSETEKMFHELNFPFKLIPNEDRNGTIEFVVNDQDHYSSEELLGMLLGHIRGLVKSNAGTLIKDFAVTVPSFFNVEQRQAMVDAAALANINLLSLVPEHQALALQYGISKRKFSEPTNVLFVDIGSGSMTAFVATFTSPKEKKSKSLGNISIKSMAWDATLGGMDFDARIANYLAQQFKDKHYPSEESNRVLSNARSMAKLMKAANKAKEVLSANKETIVSVESLFEEKDFSVSFTRETFEQIASDLFDRIQEPVKKAIVDSGFSTQNITAVELVGGMTRVPKIQDLLKGVSERDALNFSLNADEALVIGATYAGARLSPMFRVKTFSIEDLFPQEIKFQLSSRPGQSKEEKSRTLFPVNSSVPSKKSIVVSRKEDFSVSLVYGETTDDKRESPFIMNVDVSGVKEALASNNTNEAESEMLSQKSKVKVTFNINKNGIVMLDSARVEFEETFKQKQEVKVENETKEDDGKKNNNSGTKTLVRRVPLNSTVTDYYLTPLTKEHMKNSRQKFSIFQKKEEQKRRAAKALNELESFIYNTRDKLEDDEEYEMVTTEEERDDILERLKENSEWLMFENDDSDLNHTKYEERLRPLEKSVRSITRRIHEMNHRPEAVNTCLQSLNMTRLLLQNHTAIAPYSTQEERVGVEESCSEVEKWISEKLTAQEKLPLHQDPVVTADEITQRCGEPMKKLRRLSLKPKPKPKKKEIPVNETETETETEKETTENEIPEKQGETTTDENNDNGSKQQQQEEEEKEEKERTTLEEQENEAGEPKRAAGEEKDDDSSPDHDEL